ncbi:PGAP1 family protein [Nostocoides japonicum T1-X7]|uniref:PGAP1 family protein n=1 Tax=Nostocoides japonicum T1-X7 TaxID=1194083 RepID=A0A077LVY4_9MICO|nr:PGAP1 family protein [Tetrasphaera japonica T1-X7]
MAAQPLGPGDDPVPERLRALGIRPHAALYLTEPVRGAIDRAALPLAAPWLAAAPSGDGHGVLVLPGLLASDRSTKPLRRFLRRKGYYVRGWRLGRNIGPTATVMETMPGALCDLVERTGGPVTVVGWSLGGLYARYLARRHPAYVRGVVTLGSPVGVADGHRTHADRAFERLSFLHARGPDVPRRGDVGGPVPVPSTSVYSRLDGVVAWRACLAEGDWHENVEVHCSHLGFGFDPATLWLLADRLAQPAGQWRPFAPPRLLRPLYPSCAPRR